MRVWLRVAQELKRASCNQIVIFVLKIAADDINHPPFFLYPAYVLPDEPINSLSHTFL